MWALAPLNGRRAAALPATRFAGEGGILARARGFGFRFQRQVLFGKESIALRQEAAEQRRLRHLERRQRLETEAAARRALEQDERYEDPDA